MVERIREIIEKEDKSHPYCDEAITAILKRENYDIARKTVHTENISILKTTVQKVIMKAGGIIPHFQN